MKDRNRSILIVRPEGFWSSWLGATTRILNVARSLNMSGWEVTLLSARPPRSNADAAQEKAFPGKVIRTPFTGAYPYLLDKDERLRRCSRLVWKLIGERYYMRKLELGWGSRLQSWVARDQMIRKPEVIWGISTGTMAGLVAARNLARYFCCPFVVVIHDPVMGAGREYSDPLLQEQLRACYDESSAIIAVTNSLADCLKSCYPDNARKIHTAHLAFIDEEPPLRRKRDDDRLVLLHAGILAGGGGRNARVLIEGIAKAALVEPACKGKIKLRLLGGGSGAYEAETFIKKNRISDVVEILPQCSIEEAYYEMDRSDVLVVIKYESDEFDMQIPGKLFQYLGRDKPILGIMRKTEAADILVHSGLGVIAGYDPKAISELVLYLWKNKDRLQEVFKPDRDYINQFSRQNMGTKISRILDNVLKTTVY